MFVYHGLTETFQHVHSPQCAGLREPVWPIGYLKCWNASERVKEWLPTQAERFKCWTAENVDKCLMKEFGNALLLSGIMHQVQQAWLKRDSAGQGRGGEYSQSASLAMIIDILVLIECARALMVESGCKYYTEKFSLLLWCKTYLDPRQTTYNNHTQTLQIAVWPDRTQFCPTWLHLHMLNTP